VTAASHAIEIDGRRYAWRSLGAGPRLVMLNGYAATSADWSPALLETLAEGFELLCPDNLGVGGSEPAGEELTIAAMAADVEATLKRGAISRFSRSTLAKRTRLATAYGLIRS